MAIVYMAINILNGDRYVGVTKKKLSQRKSGHHSQSKEGRKTHFANALRKYGRENFTWVVLAEYSTFDDALVGEIYFIEKLKPEYNLTKGGEGTFGYVSHNRKKVICLDDGAVYESATEAAHHYGCNISSLTCSCGIPSRGKSVSAKGRHFLYFEKPLSEKERRDLILAREKAHILCRRRSKILSEPVVNDKKYLSRSRRVICIDDGNIFQSASSAARNYHSSKSAVIEMCLGKNGRKSVNGRRFMYYVGPLTKAA